jgi:DNA-binding NtrC family response regulator
MALHVLLLEPDPDRRQVLADGLRAAGWRVFETDDRAAAVESLQGGGFDGAFISLRVPQLDLAALHAAICPTVPGSPVSLDAAERLHIARTLEHTGGNRRQAALILGISRSTLLHKIRKYGLGEEGGRRWRRADEGEKT